MARNETILNVFIASPSDVSDERKILDSVISELNKTWSKSLKLRLEPIKWETDTHPNFGTYSQDVINTQIEDEYDIFVAIFWSKVGTQTPAADSGTIEEFQRAYKKYKNGKKIDIMIYFKDQPIPPSKMDAQQLIKINSLKSELGEKGGLYWTFENTEEFSSLVRVHLSRLAQKWSRDLPNQPSITAKGLHQLEQTQNEDDPEEYGILDYQEFFENSMSILNESYESIASATIRIGEQFTQRTLEITNFNLANDNTDKSSVRKLIKKSSHDLDNFSEILEQKLYIASKSRSEAFEALSKTISLQVSDLDADDDPSFLMKAICDMRSAAAESQSNIFGFKEAIDALPRLTIELNKSKRRASNALNSMLEEIETTLQSADEVLKTLASLKPRSEMENSK